MSTPHNRAEKGDFAKTVLMPGDPLRAKYIAETFLESPRLVNDVRNMLGFTGTYKGAPVSVMASGMGMPSIGIYSYELYKFYDVENIIRVGSAGSYTADVDLLDVVLASKAYSQSSYAKMQGGADSEFMYPDKDLNGVIMQCAKDSGIKVLEAPIHSGDVFYYQDGFSKFKEINKDKGCVCVEMESYALFHNANVLSKNAACLLTISDSLVTSKETTAKERETSFNDMIEVALLAAAKLDA
ncbi:purine-nucleoside phosphorylase [Butyrivibrio fibrisolvens DSM 3071]|uniref:Uridine phosphorylase n=1 Tax=Butyrivibrio fibrisolvens DSM 3071 TaxID=1121131 RepID=A0A1M6FZT1_BUTFI|nr:purine-nucleoside phosphorylase [Butyrivibrio fibrisolvens]SHJ03122.1 purine-nucleoside phosphorylase [Butyrivibrio fibrisolvens DSM 3071]